MDTNEFNDTKIELNSNVYNITYLYIPFTNYSKKSSSIMCLGIWLKFGTVLGGQYYVEVQSTMIVFN